MKIHRSVAVVTGAGAGLGLCLAREISKRGPAGLVVADIDRDSARCVATELGGHGVCADLASEAGVDAVVDAAVRQFGAIDIWIANAGTGQACDPFTDDTTFNQMWNLHAMSQVWAARALLPGWLDRRSGHFVAVVSSNALTTNPVSMAYAMTKHAQLAAVEWLAMTYGAQGVATTAFCPKGMRTPLLEQHAKTNAYARAALDGAISPEQAASMLIDAVEKNLTIVHTHPAVLADARLRIDDHKAYLRSLEELRALATEIGAPR
jgi:NAD(P)-dependent dehydrogenase (short-subunit alcohol dehydrogenase family)